MSNLQTRLLISFGGALIISACNDTPKGGVTAHIVFPDHHSDAGAGGSGATRTSGRGLRASALPFEIGRLEILAIDSTDGSTLASTNLYANPTETQIRLEPEGGTWQLDAVPAGAGRMIVGKAYLRASPDPRVSDLLLYRGRIADVEVKPGEVTNAGTLNMFIIEGVRYPPFDENAPSEVTARLTVVPEGEALTLTFDRPPEEDVAGYVIAMGLDARSPVIPRGEQPVLGTTIEGDIKVVRFLRSPIPEPITLSGLTNGSLYTILVYAYDTDLSGAPLNYSTPRAVTGVPQDSIDPGIATATTAVSRGAAGIEFSFVSPGEDGMVGTPADYHIRVAQLRAIVANKDSFDLLPQVTPPVGVKPGGEVVRFTRTWEQLRVRPGPIFVGVRAKDQSNREGPIAVIEFIMTATNTPSLDVLEPPIAVAGGLITLRGTFFGTRAGAVRLISDDVMSLTYPVEVVSWTDTEITAQIPADARSGTLEVTRVDDALSDSAYLPVIARIDAAFGAYDPPFELLATRNETVSPDVTVGALYRERDIGATYEGAVERVIGATEEELVLAPVVQTERSTAIAGTYVADRDLFMFIASNDPLSMTTAFVSNATITPSVVRHPYAVLAGEADRVGVVALDGGVGGAVPAMITFSRLGVVRTAAVNDALTQTFTVFTASTSGTLGVSYDRATIARSTSDLLLAYREVSATGAELVIEQNPGTDPAGFTEVVAAQRPRVGPNFELLHVPGLGGLDDFVIVYEEQDAMGRVADIRVLAASSYGTSAGYAPFVVDPTGSWRLEDAGLVYRGTGVYLAVLATRSGVGIEARYTEMPLDVVDFGPMRRGEHPGVVLDNSALAARGRIGCKQEPMEDCPFVWLGGSAQLLFIRR